jgi:hypothetical protein
VIPTKYNDRLDVPFAAGIPHRVALYSGSSISRGDTMKMRRSGPAALAVCVVVAVLLFQPVAHLGAAAAAAATLSCTAMESYLKTAKVVSQRGTSAGITAPSRAMLDDGTLQHEALIQTVDIKKTNFEGSRGTEVNFRDAWQFNVAGYELAKLLKLNMVPPYVERRVAGRDASLSWWIDDAMMEKDRFQKKIRPPEPLKWNEQLYSARIFHELIADTDFNMTNMLITKDWRVWMIDFTRAFRMTKTISNPKQLTRADRTLLRNMRALTVDRLQQALGRWLGKMEIEGLMARRDLIVQFFDGEVAAKGEDAVLYDLPRSGEPCGAGLQ